MYFQFAKYHYFVFHHNRHERVIVNVHITSETQKIKINKKLIIYSINNTSLPTTFKPFIIPNVSF